MEEKTITMDLAGRELKITNGPISTYASGYAIVSLGDTVIMANATMSEKAREGTDFFPLSVDYEENMYATGKIKGSRFIKRGGRPSDKAILTSRLIDRPIRPLFPKGTTNEVQLICTVLSADMEVEPGTTAMIAASMALMMSGAPFEGPIGSVRVGYHNEKIIINPTYEETENGKLNLVVAGTMDAITMVEAAIKEVSEEIILEALDLAHKEIKKICEFQLEYIKGMEFEPIEAIVPEVNEDAEKAVQEFVTDEMLNEINGETKKIVKKKIKKIEQELFEKYATQMEEDLYSKYQLADILNKMVEKNMRKNILEKEERIDGRKIDEVRKISVVPDVLPRTHGSAIFQRGETMALTITTLGGPGDSLILDTMEVDGEQRYFHHYNFPAFATGDIKPNRGPNRRAIGHGDLAERALLPVLPDKEAFPYTMWVTSEIVKCNGSSSMASVCGSTMSLMAAGVPIKKPVSGIAMGLVMDKENPSNYKILSDIQGMEDFAGDMDFKVTGTAEGLTALQMDIKVKGLSIDLLKEALEQSKIGRAHILSEMLSVIPEPRAKVSANAPMIISHQINPDFIKWVIGKGGETIHKITDECGVEIDINDDGLISITAPKQENGEKALEWIKKLTYDPKVGEIIEGKVVKIMEFGAFVELAPGKDGMVHISKLAKERVNRVEDVIKLGEMVKVKLVEIDSQGRYNLSRVAAMEEEAGGGSKKPEAKVEKTDATTMPGEEKKEEKKEGKDDWKEKGKRVPGTSAVREIE